MEILKMRCWKVEMNLCMFDMKIFLYYVILEFVLIFYFWCVFFRFLFGGILFVKFILFIFSSCIEFLFLGEFNWFNGG